MKIEDMRNMKKIMNVIGTKSKTEAVQTALKNYAEILENQDFY